MNCTPVFFKAISSTFFPIGPSITRYAWPLSRNRKGRSHIPDSRVNDAIPDVEIVPISRLPIIIPSKSSRSLPIWLPGYTSIFTRPFVRSSISFSKRRHPTDVGCSGTWTWATLMINVFSAPLAEDQGKRHNRTEKTATPTNRIDPRQTISHAFLLDSSCLDISAPPLLFKKLLFRKSHGSAPAAPLPYPPFCNRFPSPFFQKFRVFFQAFEKRIVRPVPQLLSGPVNV